jgi:hypothetical protein
MQFPFHTMMKRLVPAPTRQPIEQQQSPERMDTPVQKQEEGQGGVSQSLYCIAKGLFCGIMLFMLAILHWVKSAWTCVSALLTRFYERASQVSIQLQQVLFASELIPQGPGPPLSRGWTTQGPGPPLSEHWPQIQEQEAGHHDELKPYMYLSEEVRDWATQTQAKVLSVPVTEPTASADETDRQTTDTVTA